MLPLKPIFRLAAHLSLAIVRGGFELADFALSPHKTPSYETHAFSVEKAVVRKALQTCFAFIPGARWSDTGDTFQLHTLAPRGRHSWPDFVRDRFQKPIEEIVTCWKM